MLTSVQAPLFVPASRPDRFDKAANSGADAVILDLEDAVAVEDKDSARLAVQKDFTCLPVIIRINGSGTIWHNEDLAAVVELQPSAVLVPKCESAEEIEEIASTLKGIPIIALIETALGLENVRKIAKVENVVRLAFGSVDFCADLNCAPKPEVLIFPKFEIVLASRIAGIAGPIDGATIQLNDPVTLHKEARGAKELGMTGKLCVHPEQIAEVKAVFTPSREEITWALKILNSGTSAIQIDGVMVDEPVRARAKTILKNAESVVAE